MHVRRGIPKSGLVFYAVNKKCIYWMLHHIENFAFQKRKNICGVKRFAHRPTTQQSGQSWLKAQFLLRVP